MKNLFLFIFILFLLPSFTYAQFFACGEGHTIVICDKNTVQASGYNVQGELGNGSNINSNLPVPISSLTNINSISAGYMHSLALKDDSTVWSWGRNNLGQLGTGNNINSNIPLQLSSLTGIISISGGEYHSLALKSNGTVYSWGWNANGQLGNGTNVNSNIPVLVDSLTGVKAISAGGTHSLALKNDGTLWAWGDNSFGAFGNGNGISSNVPIQITSLTDIKVIAAGLGYSLALKNDSTVWTWGVTLGIGYMAGSATPVPVSSLSGITAIAAGAGHVLALKNDSTIWAWGENASGQLGNGTTNNTSVNSSIPGPVSYLTDVIAIAAGFTHSLVLKNDRTLWGWGDNSAGQLGNGTSNDSDVPIQINTFCQPLTTIIKEAIVKEAEMNVFPNPASRIITIKIITYKPQEDFILKVSNSLGKTVYSESLKEISDSLTKKIDLSAQPKGTYFVELQSTSPSSLQKKVEVKKIVLQ